MYFEKAGEILNETDMHLRYDPGIAVQLNF